MQSATFSTQQCGGDVPCRIEKDSMGPVNVPEARLYGAQTARSLQNFKISTEKMPVEFLRAVAK